MNNATSFLMKLVAYCKNNSALEWRIEESNNSTLNFVVKTVSVAVLKPRFAVIFSQEKVTENDAH